MVRSLIESLENPRIDRNRDSLRFAWIECDAREPGETREALEVLRCFVGSFWKRRVDFRDFSARECAGIPDGELRGFCR